MGGKIVNCPYCGKILSPDVWEGAGQEGKKAVKCTYCGSQRNWKDGKRSTPSGTVQRYICRDCGTRFSER